MFQKTNTFSIIIADTVVNTGPAHVVVSAMLLPVHDDALMVPKMVFV